MCGAGSNPPRCMGSAVYGPVGCTCCGALPCDQVESPARQSEVSKLERDMAFAAGLEAAAQAAENFTRSNRDWVKDSLWDNITKGIAANIRALKPA